MSLKRTIIMNRFILIGCLLCSLSAQTQTIITRTLSVKGNCEECRERIENAADIRGVKLSEWKPKTGVLKITYDSAKVSLKQIIGAIVSRGHDVEGLKATNEAYNKLPKCCRYRDNNCEDPK